MADYFGDAYFPARYFGPFYFGEGGTITPGTTSGYGMGGGSIQDRYLFTSISQPTNLQEQTFGEPTNDGIGR